jgi:hypothetical protein
MGFSPPVTFLSSPGTDDVGDGYRSQFLAPLPRSLGRMYSPYVTYGSRNSR